MKGDEQFFRVDALPGQVVERVAFLELHHAADSVDEADLLPPTRMCLQRAEFEHHLHVVRQLRRVFTFLLGDLVAARLKEILQILSQFVRVAAAFFVCLAERRVDAQQREQMLRHHIFMALLLRQSNSRKDERMQFFR